MIHLLVALVLAVPGFARWQLMRGGGPRIDGPDIDHGSDEHWPD